MTSANLTVIRFYQLFGEGLLFFFLILPAFFLLNAPYPFWSYLILIFVSSLIFTIVPLLFHTYLPVIVISFLVGVASLFIFNYPFLISIGIAVFIGWRFISHQMEANHNHEVTLITTTVVFTAAAILLLDNDSIMWVAVIQFINLIGGYIVSNILNQNNSFRQSYPIWLTVLGGTTIIVVTIGFYFYLARIVFIKGTDLVIGASGKLASVIDYFVDIDLDEEKVAQYTEGMKMNAEARQNLVKDSISEADPNAGEAFVQTAYWSFVGVIIIALIVVSVLLYRKFVDKEIPIGKKLQAEFGAVQLAVNATGTRLTLRNKKPDDLVRKTFYEFEVYASKNGFGRNKHETIEEWFDRLGLPVSEVEVYKKVRYGEQEVHASEVERLKVSMNRWKEKLK